MSARIEDRGDRVIVWNGNSARRGALTPQLYDCLAQALVLAQERRIRSVILTSDGPFFCAGGDMNILIERRRLSEPERRQKVDALHDLVRAIRASPVPVIAAVEGGAAGAGMSLAFACDLIVAARGAVFTAAYVKAGLVPDAGLTAALARMLPRQMVMELCLLARPLTAEALSAAGCITSLCDPEAALDTALVLADRLAAGPRDAQSAIRSLVAQAFETTEAAQLDAERDAMARAAGGPEAAEGIAAFLEKRRPEYRR